MNQCKHHWLVSNITDENHDFIGICRYCEATRPFAAYAEYEDLKQAGIKRGAVISAEAKKRRMKKCLN